jgi:hypothetical protein
MPVKNSKKQMTHCKMRACSPGVPPEWPAHHFP